MSEPLFTHQKCPSPFNQHLCSQQAQDTFPNHQECALTLLPFSNSRTVLSVLKTKKQNKTKTYLLLHLLSNSLGFSLNYFPISFHLLFYQVCIFFVLLNSSLLFVLYLCLMNMSLKWKNKSILDLRSQAIHDLSDTQSLPRPPFFFIFYLTNMMFTICSALLSPLSQHQLIRSSQLPYEKCSTILPLSLMRKQYRKVVTVKDHATGKWQNEGLNQVIYYLFSLLRERWSSSLMVSSP